MGGAPTPKMVPSVLTHCQLKDRCQSRPVTTSDSLAEVLPEMGAEARLARAPGVRTLGPVPPFGLPVEMDHQVMISRLCPARVIASCVRPTRATMLSVVGWEYQTHVWCLFAGQTLAFSLLEACVLVLQHRNLHIALHLT